MTGRLDRLRARQHEMVETLDALVSIESPSDSPTALAACAHAIGDLLQDRLGTAPTLTDDLHLVWSTGGESKVLLLGHYDTVWPLGTIERKPFAVAGDHATGPGSFDMKAGIVQLVEALATLDTLDGVTIMLTADEETGSFTSRALIEHAARGAIAALVLEPSIDGRLKTARKGTGMYTLRVTGRAAHAGLEPEKGNNALVALSGVLVSVATLGRPDIGTTVTPTTARAGSASNVVPAEATAEVDFRVAEPGEAERLDADVHALATTVAGTTLTIEGGLNRPPMPASSSADLFARARACAESLGLAPLGGMAVGGGSDGNLTAAVGTPTLDGLGAVGAGAHAEDEYAVLSAMPERAALVAELIADLLR